MTRRLVGAVASCLTLLAGLWLILVPFALGIQPENAEWRDETVTDVWSGIGLGVLGLLGLIIFSAALAQYLQALGLPSPRSARSTPAEAAEAPAAPAAPAAPTSDLDKLLSPLIAALTDDLARERNQPSTNGDTAPQPARRPAAVNRPTVETNPTEETR
ncbi:MAG TPA: hypothetical protein VIP98_19775 [Microlunatus sp.]